MMDATIIHDGATRPLSSDRWRDTIADLGFTAVIFDCDGTLVESAAAHMRCMQAAAQEQGLDMRPDWYRARAGLDRQSLFQAFRLSVASDFDIARACRTSVALYENFVHLVRPVQATLGLAASLKEQGIPIAVATNAERAVAKLSLASVGAADMFDALISISDDIPPKPSPMMFQIAAQRLAQPPVTTLVIEDSEQGVCAAQAAGMSVVLLNATEPGRETIPPY